MKDATAAVEAITPTFMTVLRIDETARGQNLYQKHSYLEGRQHSHCQMNWAGAYRTVGENYLNERLNPQGLVQSTEPDWRKRKPDTPAGIHTQIITRFTDMLLSEDTRPQLQVPTDKDTERYLNIMMQESCAWASLQDARDYKGATGSCALLVSIMGGKPRTEVLHTHELFVVEWDENHPGWKPKSVVEQKRSVIQQVNEDTGNLETVEVYETRMWDEVYETVFKDVPVDWENVDEDGNKQYIEIAEQTEHGAGQCPIIWMQNTKSSKNPDGKTDIENTYEQGDKLDKVRSFACRATVANTDPTLVHRDEPRMHKKNSQVRKGYGAKIDVSTQGGVEYLESDGQGIVNAWSTAKEIKHDILQTASCVIVDPDTAGSYRSGDALRQLYKAMEARAGRLRIPLSNEVVQLCKMWIYYGLKFGVTTEGSGDSGKIELPPKIVTKDGDSVAESYKVGEARYVNVVWGPYHKLTMSEIASLTQSLSTSNGAKQMLSQQTSTELMVGALGCGNPDEELEQIEKEEEEAMKKFEQMNPAQFSGADEEGEEQRDLEKEKLENDVDPSKEE